VREIVLNFRSEPPVRPSSRVSACTRVLPSKFPWQSPDPAVSRASAHAHDACIRFPTELVFYSAIHRECRRGRSLSHPNGKCLVTDRANQTSSISQSHPPRFHQPVHLFHYRNQTLSQGPKRRRRFQSRCPIRPHRHCPNPCPLETSQPFRCVF
jgi:hypothetical protein